MRLDLKGRGLVLPVQCPKVLMAVPMTDTEPESSSDSAWEHIQPASSQTLPRGSMQVDAGTLSSDFEMVPREKKQQSASDDSSGEDLFQEESSKALEEAVGSGTYGPTPTAPPRFALMMEKHGNDKIYTMTSPYPGIRVDSYTFKLLRRTEEQDVKDLLSPIADIEDNVEGV